MVTATVAVISELDSVLKDGSPAERIETRALIRLSTVLAPVDNAPIEVIRRMAHDDEIEVAGPVLVRSTRLSDDDLIRIAETRSQQHQLAISGRALLIEMVTDVLVRC